MDELISVIMSVYNETNSELKLSINSILTQTYKSMEFIIVDDNPDNMRIREFLKNLSDNRIRILHNDKNKGLVYSLNKALKNAKGNIIARMDADDIAINNRLEMEYFFLKEHDLDLIGSWIKLINTNNDEIGELNFPVTSKGVNHQIKYGSCLAHPTWMGKREIFFKLNGYRDIPYCEDYDFLLRAIKNGCKLGNIPYYGLNYRIRDNGISHLNQNEQSVIRRFLAKNRNQIDVIDIDKYIVSEKFAQEVYNLNIYENAKNEFREHNLYALLKLIRNKNLYIYLREKYVSIILRNFYK